MHVSTMSQVLIVDLHTPYAQYIHDPYSSIAVNLVEHLYPVPAHIQDTGFDQDLKMLGYGRLCLSDERDDRTGTFLPIQ